MAIDPYTAEQLRQVAVDTRKLAIKVQVLTTRSELTKKEAAKVATLASRLFRESRGAAYLAAIGDGQ